jgi:manganese/iron transport system substrate-binding protein
MFKNNRNHFLIVALASIAIATNSCTRTNNIAQAQVKPKVVASHNVICDLLQSIAQDTIDLTCLISADQDPHTYRPTPAQRKAIEEAQLIVYGGYQLEPQLIDLIGVPEDPEDAENATPTIALYEQAVTEPLKVEEQEADKPESKPELEPDPHVWHNVENTVAMVDYLQSIFLQINPSEAEKYLLNSTALTEQLWQLDAWIKEQITTIPEGKKVLVTTHDSLNYYAQAYYLKDYKTLQGLGTESSPTASQVRKLATEIQQTGVPTIFAELTANDRVIANVARAAKVKVSKEKLYVDGLGEAENYSQMMSHNTCAIVNGLGGKCQPFKLK